MKWPELEGAGFRIRGMRVWLAIAFLLAWCLVASRANGQDFQSWNEVDLTGSWKTNRFEKLIGFGDSPVRYRNRVLAERPPGTQARWRIFASDEVFFNLSARNWNQNRAQTGIGRRLSRRVFLDVFYLQRNTREGAPTTHALGTTLRIELKARLETPS